MVSHGRFLKNKIVSLIIFNILFSHHRAPYSPIHVCTAGEDRQALIWDLSRIPAAIEEPILAYGAAGEINNVQWSSAFPDWIAICYNNTLEILKV